MGNSDSKVIDNEDTYDKCEDDINKLRAMNEAIYKEYEVENDRIKLIDDRAGSLFNIAGIVVTFAAAANISKSTVQLPTTFKVVEILLTLAIMTCLCTSIVSLLLALRTRGYERTNLDELTDPEVQEKTLHDFLFTIAVTYCEITNMNKLATDKKVKHYNRGTLFLGLGFILVVVRFLLFFIYEI